MLLGEWSCQVSLRVFWKTFLQRATILVTTWQVFQTLRLSFPHWCVNHALFFSPHSCWTFFFCELATCRFVPTTLLSAWNEVRSCRGGFVGEAPPSCWVVRNWVMEIITPLPSRKQTSKFIPARVMVVRNTTFSNHSIDSSISKENKNTSISNLWKPPSFRFLVIWSTSLELKRFDPWSKMRTLLDLILALWVERPASYPVVIPW